jgi:hypothetical protein
MIDKGLLDLSKKELEPMQRDKGKIYVLCWPNCGKMLTRGASKIS